MTSQFRSLSSWLRIFTCIAIRCFIYLMTTLRTRHYHELKYRSWWTVRDNAISPSSWNFRKVRYYRSHSISQSRSEVRCDAISPQSTKQTKRLCVSRNLKEDQRPNPALEHIRNTFRLRGWAQGNNPCMYFSNWLVLQLLRLFWKCNLLSTICRIACALFLRVTCGLCLCCL